MILSSRKLRGNAFNHFIIGMSIPDLVFCLGCGISCLRSAVAGQWAGGNWNCNMQAVYVSFGIGSSVWMNCLVVWELQRLTSSIAKSAGGGKLVMPKPPPLWKTVLRICCVYACNLLLSTMEFITPDWLITSNAVYGLACLTLPTSAAALQFLWLVQMPLTCFLPIIFSIGAYARAYYLIRKVR